MSDWAVALADVLVALPDDAARRARIAAEMAVTSDPRRAEHLGQALVTVLESGAAGAVAPDVLHARLVLALVGDTIAAPPPPAPALAYRKRVLTVSESDGTWGVYRVFDGKPISARRFAHVTDDQPLKGQLRTARTASYVSAGVLGAGALALVTASTHFSSLAHMETFEAELGETLGIDHPPDPGAPDYARSALVTGVAAIGCVVGAAVIPIVTLTGQRNIHRYYDEGRARELVDRYNGRLLQQYGAATPAGPLNLLVSPTSLALVGSF